MKKSQAAMEFLMTYGWAMVVVLVMISALSYFGVLNPSKFLPELCIIGPGFACEDFIITKNGIVTIIIRNGGIAVLTSVTAEIQEDVPPDAVRYQLECGDEEVDIGDTVTCYRPEEDYPTRPEAGEMWKGKIILKYTQKESTIVHSKIGKLVTRVE